MHTKRPTTTTMPRAAASSSTLTISEGRNVSTQKQKTNNKKPPTTNNPPKSLTSKKRPEPSPSSDRSPPPPPKRKTQTHKTPSSEKRQARFIRRPNTAISQRIARAFEHRLYLIDQTKPSSSSCKFIILGATANVYTVRLDLKPSCTCPDFSRGNTCKHILFVMLRVLKLPMDDPRVWQKALISSELEDLMCISSINEGILADQRVLDRFREISGSNLGEEEKGKEGFKKSVQRKLEGDCPVCYEPLTEGIEAVVFCRVCGNNVHEDCFMKWSCSQRHGSVTCIYCRAVWEDKVGGDKNSKYGGDYVNLAAYSDSHGPENTSLEALYPETSMWIQGYR